MSDPRSYVVDTHALLWFLTASQRLSARARSLMQDAEKSRGTMLIIPAIVLAEAITLIERKRVNSTIEALLDAVNREPYHVVPLNMQVIRALLSVPATLEMHDRLIAATARLYDSLVISRDTELAEVVSTVW